ncbi:hypothetical protein LXL04_013409 [Taraxacum kok-saghyz]
MESLNCTFLEVDVGIEGCPSCSELIYFLPHLNKSMDSKSDITTCEFEISVALKFKSMLQPVKQKVGVLLPVKKSVLLLPVKNRCISINDNHNGTEESIMMKRNSNIHNSDTDSIKGVESDLKQIFKVTVAANQELQVEISRCISESVTRCRSQIGGRWFLFVDRVASRNRSRIARGRECRRELSRSEDKPVKEWIELHRRRSRVDRADRVASPDFASSNLDSI